MRKLVYHIAASLDGFIAGENDSVDGFLMEGEHATEFFQSISNYDAVLMGSNTYGFGLKMGLEKGQPAYPMLKNYVFSKHMTFPKTDQIECISEDPVEFVKKLKEEEGKDIWLCGGGALAHTLLEAGLMDKIMVKINPLILGKGTSLFGNQALKKSLKLTDAKTYDNGVILATYEVNG